MSGWNAAKAGAVREAFDEFRYYVAINSKETGGGTVLGENLYTAQKMFDDAVFGALSEDIHDIYVLKSRQLGISTNARAFTTFWLGMNDGLRGSMVFDTAYNTQVSRREVEEIIAGLPVKLKFPRLTGQNRDALIFDNQSWLLFMQAGTKNSKAGGGLGRSVGINYAHCSELCSWVNQEGIKSFRQSLAEKYENRLYLWESSPRGFNEWYSMWREAKADPSKLCLFIGWWALETHVIERGTREFERYGRDPPNKKERERIKAVKDLYDWIITPEQLAWYRRKVDPSRELDDDDPDDTTLVQEQPWTEMEAFQATGSSFFQDDKITAALSRASIEPKPQYFKFWPGVDFVTSDMRPAQSRREVELRLWEEPASNNVYVVSGDPAFGHDENNDHSSAQVLRCYADGLDQVAEYESGIVQPHQFAWLLWTLVGYYGSMQPGCEAGMICEINGPGEEVWRQYKEIPNLVQRGYLRGPAKQRGIEDIFNNARSYVYMRSDSMNAGHAWQFKTQTQLKVQIMEACRNHFHNGALFVRSANALEQMRVVTREGDVIGAEGRNRDDNVFSLALGIRYWEDRFRRRLIAGNRTREAERAKVSMSIIDQVQIFNRNTLGSFFKMKEAARMSAYRDAQRATWRGRYSQRGW